MFRTTAGLIGAITGAVVLVLAVTLLFTGLSPFLGRAGAYRKQQPLASAVEALLGLEA